MDCLLQAKSQYLQWQRQNHEEKTAMRSARVLSERALRDKLIKQQLALEHELALLRTKHKTELEMLKIKSRQDIKDYREYLDSLDQLKLAIADKYSHLPEALSFMIHHHAKQLLNQMWESDDLQQKIDSELQLIRFMTSINEDIHSVPDNGEHELLPLKTLQMLNK